MVVEFRIIIILYLHSGAACLCRRVSVWPPRAVSGRCPGQPQAAGFSSEAG